LAIQNCKRRFLYTEAPGVFQKLKPEN